MQFEELNAKHEAAFLEMIADYLRDDPETYALLYKRPRPWDSGEFKRFMKECQAQKMDWRPGPRKISVTRYVLLDGNGTICGNGLMRFPLDERFEYEGGNLLFDVPPSRRGHGNGAFVLNGMLFEAVRAGMARVLVTCGASDQAAIRSIEKNRGELIDVVPSKESVSRGKKISRYWIRFR
jgi:predicted acetyltransferase